MSQRRRITFGIPEVVLIIAIIAAFAYAANSLGWL